MRTNRMPTLLRLATIVQFGLTLMANAALAQSAQDADGPDEVQPTDKGDAQDGSEQREPPRFIEKQIHAKVPGPSYAKDGALLDVVCNLRLDYPHNSSHVDGTVNVVSQVACNTPVTEITLLLQLFYEGQLANSYLNSNSGAAALYNQVAAPCVNGGWQAHAEAQVIFPPGVTPPSAYETQDSQPISIDCSQ